LFLMQEKVTANLDREFQYKSAVRQLCKWRAEWGLEKFRAYIYKHRIMNTYLNDVKTQYTLGNRGEWGLWLVG